jgi:hypothetical protein
MHLTIAEDPPLTLAYPNLLQTITNTARGPASVMVVSTTVATVLVGHNLVTVSATYSWFGPTTPPERLTLLRDLRRTVTTTALTALNSPRAAPAANASAGTTNRR